METITPWQPARLSRERTFSTTLRPLRVGELLDRVVYFYRAGFIPLTLYCMVITLPITLLTFLSVLFSSLPLLSPDLIIENPGLFLGAQAGQLCLSLFAGAIAVVMAGFQYGGLAIAVQGWLFEGRVPGIRELFSRTTRRFGKLFGFSLVSLMASFAVGIISLILFVTVIGSPFAMAIYSLYTFALGLGYNVLIYEDSSILDALRRGWTLITGGGWRTFAYLMVSFIFNFFFAFLVVGLLGVAVAIPSVALENEQAFLISFTLLQPIATLAVAVLTIPVVCGAFSFLYFDLRVRLEGLDMALLPLEANGQPLALGQTPTSQEELLGPRARRAIGQLALGYFLLMVGFFAIVAALAFIGYLAGI